MKRGEVDPGVVILSIGRGGISSMNIEDEDCENL